MVWKVENLLCYRYLIPQIYLLIRVAGQVLKRLNLLIGAHNFPGKILSG